MVSYLVMLTSADIFDNVTFEAINIITKYPMKKHTLIKLLLILYLSVLFSIVGSSPSISAINDQDTGVDNLSDYAIRLYLTKEIDQAVEEFKKILLIDPENISAKYYLNKISNEYEKHANVLKIDAPDERLKRLSDMNIIIDKETEVYQSIISSLEQSIRDLELVIVSQKQMAESTDKGGNDSEILELETRIRKLNDILAEKDLRISELNKLSNATSANAEDFQRIVDQKDAKISDLMQEIDDYEQLNIEAIDTLKERKYKIESLQNQMSELQVRFDYLKEEMIVKDKKIKRLDEQVALKSERLETITGDKEMESQGLTDIIVEKEEEIEELKDQIIMLQDDVKADADKSNALQEKVGMIENTLIENKKEVENKNKIIEEKDQNIAVLKEELLKFKNELNVQKAKKDDDVKSWQNEKQDLTKTVKGLEKELNQSKQNNKKKMTELLEKNDTLQMEIATLKEQNNSLSAQLNTRDKVSADDKSKIDNLKKVTGDLKKNHADEINTLKEQIAASQNTIKKYNQDSMKKDELIDEYKRKISDLKDQKNEFSSMTDEAQKTLEEQKKIVEKVKTDAKSNEANFKETKNQLALSQKKIDELNLVIKIKEKQIKEHEKQLKNFSNDLGRLNRELSKERKSQKELLKQRETAEMKSNRSVKKVDKFRSENNELQAQIDALNEKLNVQEQLMEESTQIPSSNRTAHINKLIQRIGNSKSELRLANSRLENVIEEKEIWEDKYNKLSQQFSALDQDLNSFKKDAELTKRENVLLKAQLTDEEDGSQNRESLNDKYKIVHKRFKNLIANDRLKISFDGNNIIFTLPGDMLFGPGSSELSRQSVSLLSKLALVLNRDLGNYKVNIEGHTDNQPIRFSDWDSNFELSMARALSVYHYFTNDSGLSSKRFSVTGKGEFQPVAGNDTDKGRSLNRRVDVIVYPNKISTEPANNSAFLNLIKAR